jgi:hypothetical protein
VTTTLEQVVDLLCEHVGPEFAIRLPSSCFSGQAPSASDESPLAGRARGGRPCGPEPEDPKKEEEEEHEGEGEGEEDGEDWLGF